MTPSVPILLYHHVAPARPVIPEAFEAQLRFLRENGYGDLSMEELMQILLKTKEIPDRAFVISFDDGYRDSWTHAFPILQRLSMKAIIYLVTERVGTEGFLSWSEIRAMAESGLVTFGSHTHTHRQFVRRDPYRDLEQELRQSKTLIEDELLVPCEHLAWPWGDYETKWIPLVKSVGYRSAATTLSGANAPGKNPYALKRINVRKPDLDWFVRRVRRHEQALWADLLGPFNGLDRRFKVWWNHETPYSHG